ncbi:hypothetical protein SAMN05444162_2997 [Paenibacillaceae bacterium GAS479]|nr:hypothetical protein SAMN05444162_2997 [Paenibacillaceae bacterium GAS479]
MNPVGLDGCASCFFIEATAELSYRRDFFVQIILSNNVAKAG